MYDRAQDPGRTRPATAEKKATDAWSRPLIATRVRVPRVAGFRLSSAELTSIAHRCAQRTWAVRLLPAGESIGIDEVLLHAGAASVRLSPRAANEWVSEEDALRGWDDAHALGDAGAVAVLEVGFSHGGHEFQVLDAHSIVVCLP